MNLYSYHVFMLPFQWEHIGKRNQNFTEKTDIRTIIPASPEWINLTTPQTEEYKIELYNEKNFFYRFVHDVLYENSSRDNPVIKHFERREAYDRELTYTVNVLADYESTYHLNLKSIVLNLYSTGTGTLIFYLINNKYPDVNDIKRINQFGRRILPPFIGMTRLADLTKESELAGYIAIEGLEGPSINFHEDFSGFKSCDAWKPATFITSLISDLDPGLEIKPVTDDRMFVMCFLFNKQYADNISKNYDNWVKTNDWYSLLFIDRSGPTCQNESMMQMLSQSCTNERWQKYGTLYGITRYSFIAVAGDFDEAPSFLLTHFRTMYVRIVELALVQRASILRFSGEVTQLSSLSHKPTSRLVERIGDFYKAYIRFVNQIYFREVTAQEQGIEFYDLLVDKMRLKDQVKDLDGEISELHQYATLIEDKKRNESLANLTILGTTFLIPTLVTGFLGMNLTDNLKCCNLQNHLFGLILMLIPGLIVAPILALCALKTEKRSKRHILFGGTLAAILTTIILYLINFSNN